MAESELAHAVLTRAILEAFFQTFRELGAGFPEVIYQRALAIVLTEKGLRAAVNCPLQVRFHQKIIGTFEADLVVNETVLLEVKARQELDGYAQGQLLNYLKVCGGGVGLLLNFGRTSADFKRVVVGDPTNSLPNLPRCAPSMHEPVGRRPVAGGEAVE